MEPLIKPAKLDSGDTIASITLSWGGVHFSWLDNVPPVRMRKEENRRIRWITYKEAQRLLNELPEHLQDMACFTLATGLRQSNVTELMWSNVDLVRCHALVHPEESKTGRAIPVPLNQDAIAILISRKGSILFMYLPIINTLLLVAITMPGGKH
jgi:integrase